MIDHDEDGLHALAFNLQPEAFAVGPVSLPSELVRFQHLCGHVCGSLATTPADKPGSWWQEPVALVVALLMPMTCRRMKLGTVLT